MGFKNISADLIIGFAGQTTKSVCCDAEKLLSLGITHISSYMLQVEEGTPLYSICQKDPSAVLSDDKCSEIFEKLVEFLAGKGFNRYEVSNFAKKGFESRHNLKYWSGEDYLGFGLSATSTIAEKRITNGKTFTDYYKGGKEIEVLGNIEKIEEKIMLGLRCFLGFDISEIEKLGYDIKANKNFQRLIKGNILIEKEGRVYLNKNFFSVNNQIITNILP